MTRAQTRPKPGESLPRAADVEQPDLFGAQRPSRLRAAARSTDPDTSHQAAKRATRGISLKQLAVLDLFQRLCAIDAHTAQHDERWTRAYERLALQAVDATSDGAWWPHQTESGLRTRRSELVTLKYIVDSGVRIENDNRARCIAWMLTPAGLALDVKAFRITLENKLARRKQYRGKNNAGEIVP